MDTVIDVLFNVLPIVIENLINENIDFNHADPKRLRS